MNFAKLVFLMLILILGSDQMKALHAPYTLLDAEHQSIYQWKAGNKFIHSPATGRDVIQYSCSPQISHYKYFSVQSFLVDWSMGRNVSLFVLLYNSFCKERKAERLFPHHDFW